MTAIIRVSPVHRAVGMKLSPEERAVISNALTSGMALERATDPATVPDDLYGLSSRLLSPRSRRWSAVTSPERRAGGAAPGTSGSRSMAAGLATNATL